MVNPDVAMRSRFFRDHFVHPIEGSAGSPMFSVCQTCPDVLRPIDAVAAVEKIIVPEVQGRGWAAALAGDAAARAARAGYHRMWEESNSIKKMTHNVWEPSMPGEPRVRDSGFRIQFTYCRTSLPTYRVKSDGKEARVVPRNQWRGTSRALDALLGKPQRWPR